ncbi:hypothetical protein ACJ73_08545 [Blastomyces percursus]|uniref:DUF3824 domain-containing protein n=1 Tax=Blastomyces percursus TaxID=1658174 RepID=A0A1J9QIU1_9EURO|nr:hypothetical protein ACJ73_08545 [Blastomyces percursus]
MASSYYENHPYNTQHRRVQTADYYEPSYATSRPPNSRWGGPADLVRPDETEDSQVEEIHREFPPGSYAGGNGANYGYGRSGHSAIYAKRRTDDPSVRRTHSVGGHGRDRHGYRHGYYHGRDEDYRRSRGHGHGNRRERDRDHNARRPYSRSPSRTPSPRPRRRKSLSEQALAAFGLGGATDSHSSRRHGSNRYYYNSDYDHSRSHRRRRRHSRSRSRSRTRSRDRDDKQKELTRTLKAVLTAGAAEAYRARKEPGGWTGEKGKRVLTAAIGAGGVNKLIDGPSDKHSKRHLIESTLAGLATNRVVNGPRSRSRSRGRARSEGPGKKELASAGLLAAAGKAAYDHYRSKSRDRDARSGYSSEDESSPDRSRRSRGSKKRSQSVSEYLNKGLAALGLGEEKGSSGHDSRRRRERRWYDDDSDSDFGYSDKYQSRRRRSDSRDSYSRDVGRLHPSSSFSSLRDRGAVIPLTGSNTGAPSLYASKYRNSSGNNEMDKYKYKYKYNDNDNDTDSDSPTLSTDEEKRTHRKLHRRQLVTTGLATLATVHAGHSIVKSIKKREERNALLCEGGISPDEARRQRTKNNLQDVASVAVAAIGVKSAVDEWKDAAQHHAEWRSFKDKCKEGRMEKERAMMGKTLRSRSWSLDGRERDRGHSYDSPSSPVSVKDAPRYFHDGRGNLLRY